MEAFKDIGNILSSGLNSMKSLEEELLKRKDQPEIREMLGILSKSKNALKNRDLQSATDAFNQINIMVDNIAKKNDKNTGRK